MEVFNFGPTSLLFNNIVKCTLQNSENVLGIFCKDVPILVFLTMFQCAYIGHCPQVDHSGGSVPTLPILI